MLKTSIKSLRNDCSTVHDCTLSPTKPVAEYIASSLAYIINNCIKIHTFTSQWKIAGISPILEVKNTNRKLRLQTDIRITNTIKILWENCFTTNEKCLMKITLYTTNINLQSFAKYIWNLLGFTKNLDLK